MRVNVGGETEIFESSDRFTMNLKVNLLEIFIDNSLFLLVFLLVTNTFTLTSKTV